MTSRTSGPETGSRAGFAVAVLAAVAGGGLALWALGQDWTSVSVPRPAPLPADTRTQTGSELLPWAPALAFVALAGGIALLAVRRVGRAVVAVVLVATGLALLAGGATGLAGADTAFRWPVLSLVGGALVAVAGALVLARGRTWTGVGERYESPAPRAVVPGQDAAGVWDALDRGDDPTVGN